MSIHIIYVSHNKYYSYYYDITDIDATKPVHSDSDSSDLPDIPPRPNVPGHYVDLPGKGLCQSHAPHSSTHQKRSLIQLLHQQGKNKML